MNDCSFEVKCLQKHPEYFEQTVTLLNNQWPRSRTARLRSLEQGSKDGLPTSLVLLRTEPTCGKKIVIAHSKISPVPHKPHLCFVESVVVAPDLRGKGLGRLIMQETEEHVKKMGITTVYLTTFDQQDFYRKLGYNFTDPIVVFGGSSKLAEKTDNFNVLSTVQSGTSQGVLELIDQVKEKRESSESTSLDLISPRNRCENQSPSLAPAPPPPPPPPSGCIKFVPYNNNNTITASKLTMSKFLTS